MSGRARVASSREHGGSLVRHTVESASDHQKVRGQRRDQVLLRMRGHDHVLCTRNGRSMVGGHIKMISMNLVAQYGRSVKPRSERPFHQIWHWLTSLNHSKYNVARRSIRVGEWRLRHNSRQHVNTLISSRWFSFSTPLSSEVLSTVQRIFSTRGVNIEGRQWDIYQ
jgi:hypothetical protein